MSPQVRVRLYTSPSIRNTFGHYNRHSSLFFSKGARLDILTFQQTYWFPLAKLLYKH